MSDDLRELAVRLLLACVAITWLAVLWRGHRDPALRNFTLQSLVMTKEGFMDRVAFMEIGSWLAYSLIILWNTVHATVTENQLLIYVGWPAIRAGVASGIKAFTSPPAPPAKGPEQ